MSTDQNGLPDYLMSKELLNQSFFAKKESVSELTFGQKLVGLTFNPSGDANVNKAKQLCADLADLLYNHHHNGKEVTMLQQPLYDHANGEILNAQMNVVKVLTLKY